MAVSSHLVPRSWMSSRKSGADIWPAFTVMTTKPSTKGSAPINVTISILARHSLGQAMERLASTLEVMTVTSESSESTSTPGQNLERGDLEKLASLEGKLNSPERSSRQCSVLSHAR
jgi:hypothetical protein